EAEGDPPGRGPVAVGDGPQAVDVPAVRDQVQAGARHLEHLAEGAHDGDGHVLGEDDVDLDGRVVPAGQHHAAQGGAALVGLPG
ncbi:hypothetical protein CWM41_28525, partial [Escherichia coli]